jgi:hypothetical protein
MALQHVQKRPGKTGPAELRRDIDVREIAMDTGIRRLQIEAIGFDEPSDLVKSVAGSEHAGVTLSKRRPCDKEDRDDNGDCQDDSKHTRHLSYI